MSVSVVYRCSICGEARKQSNHWFVARRWVDGLIFDRWQTAIDQQFLQEESTQHLCGRECARKLLERFLAAEPEPKEVTPE